MTSGYLVRMAAAAGAALAMVSAPLAAHAAQADPAATQIEAFDAQLIDMMKEAKSLGAQGRFHKLEPVVARMFDTPTMIRFAVGPAWPSFSAAQQQQLTTAFGKLTAASLAHNFSGYAGQHFEISSNVVTRGPDKVVSTRLVSPNDQPVSIAYRMRQSGGAWKIIDVYYNGAISQLTTRRADFQSSITQGGASALLTHLNALVDKEMK